MSLREQCWDCCSFLFMSMTSRSKFYLKPDCLQTISYFMELSIPQETLLYFRKTLMLLSTRNKCGSCHSIPIRMSCYRSKKERSKIDNIHRMAATSNSKYLGINISTNLSLNTHIPMITKKSKHHHCIPKKEHQIMSLTN